MKIRKSQERKFFDHGWLKTIHTFSFAGYYDPNFMGFRSLRVINEDRVSPNHGFPAHDHRDMEIISVVLEGELAHRDSMGNEEVLHADEVQVMSAGTGVTHSEFNPSSTNPVHFLQIWIVPNKKNIAPRYQQSKLPEAPDQWHLLASPTGPLLIQQDTSLYYINLIGSINSTIPPNRYGWLQVISGELIVNDISLQSGDAVSLESGAITLKAIKPSRLLFFDLN